MLLAKKLISSNDSGSDLFGESESEKEKLEIESAQKVNILSAGKELLARVAKSHISRRYMHTTKTRKINTFNVKELTFCNSDVGNNFSCQ